MRIFAFSYWPLISVSFIILYVSLRHDWDMPSTLRRYLVIITSVGCLALIFVFLLLSETSVYLIFDKYTSLGAITLFASLYQFNTSTNTLVLPLRVFLFAFGAACCGLMSWYVIGDFLLPRHEIIGNIERIERPNNFVPFNIYINRVSYLITSDLLINLHVGEQVRATIGAGSASIFQIAPFASAS